MKVGDRLKDWTEGGMFNGFIKKEILIARREKDTVMLRLTQRLCLEYLQCAQSWALKYIV